MNSNKVLFRTFHFRRSFLTSSLTPICLNSILVLNIAAKSFTKSLKSILPSALKKNNNLLLSNLYSTSVNVMSKLCSFTFSSQIFKASFSFFLFSSSCFLSLYVAILIIFFSGFTNLSSGISLFGTTTSPNFYSHRSFYYYIFPFKDFHTIWIKKVNLSRFFKSNPYYVCHLFPPILSY